MVFMKKDPVAEAKKQAERAREILAEAERRQAEIEERSRKTPVVEARAPDVVSVPEPPSMEKKELSVEERAVVAELERWAGLYDGVFPELGASGDAAVVRGLLFGIYCELRRLGEKK